MKKSNEKRNMKPLSYYDCRLQFHDTAHRWVSFYERDGETLWVALFQPISGRHSKSSATNNHDVRFLWYHFWLVKSRLEISSELVFYDCRRAPVAPCKRLRRFFASIVRRIRTKRRAQSTPPPQPTGASGCTGRQSIACRRLSYRAS